VQPLGAVVLIFVLFKNMTDAVKAQSALDKRWFGGKVISAQFFEETKFVAKQYAIDF